MMPNIMSDVLGFMATSQSKLTKAGSKMSSSTLNEQLKSFGDVPACYMRTVIVNEHWAGSNCSRTTPAWERGNLFPFFVSYFVMIRGPLTLRPSCFTNFPSAVTFMASDMDRERPMEFIKSKVMETRGGYANEIGLNVGRKNNHGRNSCF